MNLIEDQNQRQVHNNNNITVDLNMTDEDIFTNHVINNHEPATENEKSDIHTQQELSESYNNNSLNESLKLNEYMSNFHFVTQEQKNIDERNFIDSYLDKETSTHLEEKKKQHVDKYGYDWGDVTDDINWETIKSPQKTGDPHNENPHNDANPTGKNIWGEETDIDWDTVELPQKPEAPHNENHNNETPCEKNTKKPGSTKSKY